MKIYLFNPENGVYLGEDFADDPPMRRGEHIVPSDATTIAPPVIGHGQVLVFNALEQRWDVRHHQVKQMDKNALNALDYPEPVTQY